MIPRRDRCMRKTGVPGYLNSVEGPGESEENPIYIVEDDDSAVETPDFMTQNAPGVSEGDRFALPTSPPNFAVFHHLHLYIRRGYDHLGSRSSSTLSFGLSQFPSIAEVDISSACVPCSLVGEVAKRIVEAKDR